MKKIVLVIALSFLVLSCSKRTNCDKPVVSKGMLVAYRVAKHSHLWLRDINTDSIYDVGGLGGRREPVMALGDVIDIKVCGNEVVSDVPVRYPDNTDTRFVFLSGYKQCSKRLYLMD